MYVPFNEILAERLNKAGVKCDGNTLEKLNKLPRENKDFILSWDLHWIGSLEQFWDEVEESSVAYFQSYSKQDGQFVCLELTMDDFIQYGTTTGKVSICTTTRDGEVLTIYKSNKMNFGCDVLSRRVAHNEIKRIVNMCVSYFGSNIRPIRKSAVHPFMFGFRGFLQDCYRVNGVNVDDYPLTWVYGNDSINCLELNSITGTK